MAKVWDRWIEGTCPGQSLSKVAHRAIRYRMKAVWHYLPLAARRADEDVEHVHQVRVASRRALAALQVFADVLPKRRARWMKKWLRQVRRAAGEARDLDVFGLRLAEIVRQEKGTHLRPVLKQIAIERRAAQRPLRASYKQARRRHVPRRVKDLLARIRWRHDSTEPDFLAAATGQLGRLTADFFAAATAGLSEPEALHEMRIRGKQLRYAMELLAGAFSPSFRDTLYPVFGEVQERLGTINDHVTAIVMIRSWLDRTEWNGSHARLAELAREEARQLALSSEQFGAWWHGEYCAALRAQFDGHLVRPTGDAL